MNSLRDQFEKAGYKSNVPAWTQKGRNTRNYNDINHQSSGVDMKPMQLPEDFVDKAEQVMGEHRFKITTSKIRNILSLVNDIFNVESLRTENKLTKESIAKIQMMRVRILYEAGRDEKNVKPFILKSQILNYIKDIGDSRKKLIDFAHYMEALVAYHRYFGGRD